MVLRERERARRDGYGMTGGDAWPRGAQARLGRGLVGPAGRRAATTPAAARGRERARDPDRAAHRNPDAARAAAFAEEELDELAASIREKGVLQPILVRPSPATGDDYEIVAGERRWRAAQRAGLHERAGRWCASWRRPGALEIAIIENVQRDDLNADGGGAGYGC